MHSMHGMPQDERHRHGNAWNYAPPPSYYDERRTPTLLPPARDRALPPGAPAGIPLPPLRATLYREEREEIRDPREWRAPLHHRDPTYASSAEYVPSRSSAQPRLELFSHSAPPSSATVSRKRFLQDHHHHHEEEDDGDMEEHPDRFGPAQGYYHHSNSTGPTGAHAEGPFTIATRELTAVNSASSSSSKKRSRRMSNSERGKLYRSRRKEYVETLEEQLEEMKRELEELRLHQTKSSTTTANSTASHPDNAYALMDATAVVRDRSRAGFARTVCEYFSLFQFGVVHPVGGANSTSSPQNQNGMSPGAVSSTNPQASRQIAVLQTLVDPNMRFGQQFGIQMLMEQWERYSTYHSALKFDLNSLEISMDDPLPMIVATASLKVRFSRTTIEKVFPHVLWNEELVQRLIGLDIEYPVSNKFYFGADGKIKRYETEVDFVSAFVQALGSTRDAMQLVGNALIKEQSRIGPEGVDDSTSSSGIDPTGRSPTGSTVSSQSSTPSSASAAPTTEVPAARYRYKQSEPRTTEQVEEEEYDHPAQQHASTEYYDRNRRDYRQPAYNPDHFRGDTTDHRRHHNFDRDSPFTKAPERPSHPQRDGHSPPPEQFV